MSSCDWFFERQINCHLTYIQHINTSLKSGLRYIDVTVSRWVKEVEETCMDFASAVLILFLEINQGLQSCQISPMNTKSTSKVPKRKDRKELGLDKREEKESLKEMNGMGK